MPVRPRGGFRFKLIKMFRADFAPAYKIFLQRRTLLSPANAEENKLMKNSIKNDTCELFSHVCFATPLISRSCTYRDSQGKSGFRASIGFQKYISGSGLVWASTWDPFTALHRTVMHRIVVCHVYIFKSFKCCWNLQRRWLTVEITYSAHSFLWKLQHVHHDMCVDLCKSICNHTFVDLNTAVRSAGKDLFLRNKFWQLWPTLVFQDIFIGGKLFISAVNHEQEKTCQRKNGCRKDYFQGWMNSGFFHGRPKRFFQGAQKRWKFIYPFEIK